MTRAVPEAAVSGRPNAARDAVDGVLAGLRVFMCVAGLGVAIGLAEYAASGGAYRLLTWLKVGALYLASFFGIGVRVDVANSELFLLRLPLMTGTALAGWLLFRVGRRAGPRAGRLGVVWIVAGFVLPVWAIALPARLLFPDLGGPGADATVGAIEWQVLLFPMVFAAAAVSVGWWHAQLPRSNMAAAVRRTIEGGVRSMFLAALFAFAGMLMLAAIHPDRTAEYGRWLGSQGRGGTLLLGHELLAAPNISLFVFAPSMGGATTIGETGAPTPAALRMRGIDPLPFIPPGFPGRTFGWESHLFLLVPAAATVLGGRWSAAGAEEIGPRLARGAASGLVFALGVTGASGFAAIAAPLSRAQLPIRVGVSLASTAALALAWGLAGGALGALLPQAVGAGPGAGAEPPLSPTSA